MTDVSNKALGSDLSGQRPEHQSDIMSTSALARHHEHTKSIQDAELHTPLVSLLHKATTISPPWALLQ